MATAYQVVPLGGAQPGGSAPVSFASGTDQAAIADVVVEWDFDNDDDFSEAVEDVTEFVIAAETLAGRDFPSNLTGEANAGQLKLTLDNSDDRFSYFNASSPLVTGANSLRTGRKIRLRTSSAVVTGEPQLLAYDRFETTNASLHQKLLEFGSFWFQQISGHSWSSHDGRAWADDAGSVGSGLMHNAFVDVDTSDHYVQIRCSRPQGNNWIAVAGRAAGSTTYIYAKLGTNAIELREVIAGVDSLHATYSFIPWEGLALGLNIQGQTADVYVDGTVVISHAVTGSGGAFIDDAGILAEWEQFDNDPMWVEEFYVWSDVPSEIEGIMWTGDVKDVRTTTVPGGPKVAEVTAEGWLARAALADVTSPVVPHGALTGILVGDVLARAKLLHPPGVIDGGVVTTGAIALDDAKALDIAREFEETEIGFIHEMNEGPIGFRDKNDRINGSVQAWFTDTPGSGQYPYAGIDPYDFKQDVINRVTAGVAPDQPSGITITVRTAQTNAGVANHVDVLMPTLAAGDLVIVIIASTVASSGVNWHNPIWWGRLREFAGEDDDSIRTRVYSKPCDGTESGTTVRFYTNTGTLGGAWVAMIYRIENWFENAAEGVAVSDFVDGHDPPGIEPGWGRVPTLFILIDAGLTSVAGGALSGQQAPAGYGPTLNSQFVNHATNGFDVALQTAWWIKSTEREDPSTFSGLSGFAINESFVIAVRGYNGPFTKPTLKQALAGVRPVGGTGRYVTVEDLESQADHNLVRSHSTASVLFASETDAEAYGEEIVARYGDDRPIVAITFHPVTSTGLRNQAIRRRVGEKIHLTANGDTGLGIEDDFIIESINHRISDGGKMWETTWELAPV